VGGNLYIKNNYCKLLIKFKPSVLRVIYLINGYMRTPKIEAFHRIIQWYYFKYNYNINLLCLDQSPLNNNSWLSGYIDADGSFYLNWLKKGRATNLQYYMRVKQRQNSHRSSLVGISYLNILSRITTLLSVNLQSHYRIRKNHFQEYSYKVRSGNYISNYIILSYLLKFPLFSYKYRAVQV